MENSIFSILFRPINFDNYRLVHSMKTAVACLIGVVIEKYFDLPSGQWIPITSMVVMSAQTRFGGALQKAYMRSLGTFAGIITTITTLFLFGTNPLAMFLVVFCSCLLFTYIASNKGDISYAGTLGGVTVLLTLTATNTNIRMAIERGLYIVIGIVIALVISRFIFPIHARDIFRFNVSNTLRNIKKLYSATILMNIKKNEQTADSTIETIIIENLSEQPRLIFEASAGSRVFAAKHELYAEIVNSERRLHRLTNLMYRAICEIENIETIKNQLTTICTIHTSIENELENLRYCFRMELAPKPDYKINTEEAIATINDLVQALPQNDPANKILAEHSFLFFMEQILKEIEALYNLINKVNANSNETT